METQSRPHMPVIFETIQASSPSEVADVLRAASERGTPVIPIGGGTSLHIGNVTDQEYIGLDLGEMSGVREYHPTDLTASFRAGTTLAEVQRVLAEEGQELPVDMAASDMATLGGMVASGFAGPRRLGSGTLKDLIIGCEYVRGDGLIAKAGGMLVKNVSGFEIPRFLHGSWGALAVITAINVKVVPKPKADMTFLHHEASLASSLEAQGHILERHPSVSAIVSEWVDGHWELAVRLLGRKSALDAQVSSMRQDLGSDTQVGQGPDRWQALNDRWASVDDHVRVVVSGASAEVARLGMDIAALDGLTGMSISLGTGTIRGSFNPASMSREEMVSRLSGHAVSWVIESAPASWVGDMSVWGPPRSDRALVQAIKSEFDPGNVLNRGRLFV